MKKIIITILILFLFCLFIPQTVSANTTTQESKSEQNSSSANQIQQSSTTQEQTTDIQSSTDTEYDVYSGLYEQSGAKSLYDMLSNDTKGNLGNLGVDGPNAEQLSGISFLNVLKEIVNVGVQNAKEPLKAVGCLLAIMLIYAIFDAFKDSLNVNITKQVLDTVTTLCITCALIIPIVNVISNTVNTISTACNFMLAYIPIMVAVMIAAGNIASGSSYYAVMIIMGEAVGQVSSRVIVPLLNMFLGISVTSAVVPSINLKGFTSLFGKTIKWLLAFIMTLFSAVLSFKSIITTSMDNISTRAVRFTLSSFIPVVGSALAEAYKTIQGSINLLKSGIGVFVIISVAFIFLPIIAQCIIWILSVQVSKSVAEVLNLTQPCSLLESVNTVLTTLLAVILCVMAIFIISTAVILMAGGAS